MQFIKRNIWTLAAMVLFFSAVLTNAGKKALKFSFQQTIYLPIPLF